MKIMRMKIMKMIKYNKIQIEYNNKINKIHKIQLQEIKYNRNEIRTQSYFLLLTLISFLCY